MVSTSENESKEIYAGKVTETTFEGRQLFYCGSNTSTYEPSLVHSSHEKESSSNHSSNEGSCDEFKCHIYSIKSNKSMVLEDLVEIQELTPAANDTPMAIEDLSSFHEERSFMKYKCDSKTLKRKIDDDVDTPVSDLETKVDATNKFITSKPIRNKLKIPRCSIKELEQPLGIEDIKKIKNVDQLTVQKQCSNQLKTKDFNRLSMVQETSVIYEFFTKGIDIEDINYLKQSYESMMSINHKRHYWLNETHWTSHPETDIPNEVPHENKIDEWKIHDTGCARTEGYYKLDSKQKVNYKYHFRLTVPQIKPTKEHERIKQSTGKMLALSREARSYKRQLSTPVGTESSSELFQLNVLKFRKRQLKFGKSAIHDWGLFAIETIAADQMIIEYVGEMIRPIVADTRERQYEATGVPSSYLFKIDLDTIVDATKCGNFSRFINHSCNPNCYARVIQIDGKKKIVIYSKQPIIANEEITYDYKFPLEEIKIPCLCGAHCCRGTLN